jgi:pyruvate,orthophosphate dikinase
MMPATNKQVFVIADASSEWQAGGLRAMGFKAYNLARMAAIGLPVPPAFVLGTGFCAPFANDGAAAQEELRRLLAAHIRWLEVKSALTYGGSRKPLLVSVRSGAPVSMPGMMDTVLNVGLTDATLRGLLRMTGNPRLVWDSYRRLIQSFAETVYAAKAQPFDDLLRDSLSRAGLQQSSELDARGMSVLAQECLRLFRKLTGHDFPQDPMAQLEQAAGAVFRSWNTARAIEYRKMHGIDETLGTAVTIQRMVFGNAGGLSGSGVAFTRNPATGDNELYLDFLFNAQGEDVVSGRRAVHDPEHLAVVLPQVYEHLLKVARSLETEFKDTQELEFTVQEGTLYLLQSRTAKRTARAALRIAVDQVAEGLISRSEAMKRLEGVDLETITIARVEPDASTPLLCRAVPASVGVTSGAIVLDVEQALKLSHSGTPVILVREETTTADLAGIAAADGLLTALGGRTSHAAVVARQLNKVCLVGCASLEIDRSARSVALGGVRLREGDTLSLDANTGSVFSGRPKVTIEKPAALLREVSCWRRLELSAAAS